MELSQLTKDQQRILSYVKTAVVLGLLEPVSEYDEEAKKLIQNTKYTLQINVGGGPTRYIEIADGKLTYHDERKGLPSLTLYFPTPADANKKLGGGKGSVIPLPGSLKLGSIIKNFNALSGRLSYYMQGGEEVRNANFEFIAKMLLTASIIGVAQVANEDPFVEPFTRHIKDGIVQAYVEGRPDLSAYIVKKDGKFKSFRGMCPTRPNCNLIFENVETAFNVLTGKENATVAMAFTQVKVTGNLNMIKNLFPVLDQLSFYLSVK